MNAILQEERSIVSAEPGTTREALEKKIAFYKERLTLVDTPGIRRMRAIDEELESEMVKSSLQALKRSDIVLLLVDASEGTLVDQELKLGFYAFQQQHKALIVLFNKTDLATEESELQLDQTIKIYGHLLNKVPMLNISCKTGKNIGKVLPLVKTVWNRYSQELPQEEVSELFISSLERKPLMRSGKELKIRKVKVLSSGPPRIGMAVNEPGWFGDSQKAFFENILRKNYDLVGVPIKFVIRKKLG